MYIVLLNFIFFVQNFGSNSSNSVNNSTAHVNNTFTVDIDDTDVDVSASSSVTIEPLPDISGKVKLPSVPLQPKIGCLERSKQDASLKMIGNLIQLFFVCYVWLGL
jgi:hypothetical protein